jgi:hypothetical protein
MIDGPPMVPPPMLGQDDPGLARRQAMAQLLAQHAQGGPSGGPLGAAAQGGQQLAQALLAKKLMQLQQGQGMAGGANTPTFGGGPGGDTLGGPGSFPLTPG